MAKPLFKQVGTTSTGRPLYKAVNNQGVPYGKAICTPPKVKTIRAIEKPFIRKAWLILHVSKPHRLTFHQPYGLLPLSNVMPVKLVQCGRVFGLGNPSRGKRKKVKPRTDQPTTIKRKDSIW